MASREISPAGAYFKYSDIIVAAAVIWTVIMMIIPIPRQLLDFLITVNISCALIILLVTMYNADALEFSVFPTLLLIMTLFRLSLNITATRLILLHGDAGSVIKTFGEFVMGSNPVVGFVIFLILVVIQFVVITRGAERVAEVAARFTLDAMPGKQMSIDADLNAGLITEEEARRRRQEIQREADFYGAMDGASKFVKGDAIAAIIIIIINIIGGFIIGMVQMKMSALQALHTFTILTVGEGLVAQIPALLISTATGIIVTRAEGENNLGQNVSAQVFTRPKVLAIAAGALVVLALLGMPKVPFFLMAALLGTFAYSLNQAQKKQVLTEEEKKKEAELEKAKKPENVTALLHVDPLEVEIGYALIPLVSGNNGGDLLDRVVMIRRQCALELGIILPPVRVRDNVQLPPNSYVIKVKGVKVAEGEVMPDHYLAMAGGVTEEEIPGIETREPAFGMPAKWIAPALKEKAEMAGYTVVDPSSVIATHLSEIIKRHAWEILTRQDVQALLDNVKSRYPAVVEDVVPGVLTLGEVQKVLVNLLKERVSIRDMVTILETLADHGRVTRDPDVLTEYVRQAFSRTLARPYVAGDGKLHVLTLDPAVEQAIRDGIQRSEHGSFVVLEPEKAQALYNSLRQGAEKLAARGLPPVVLTAPLVRIYLRKLVEKYLPQLVVISYSELEPDLEVQTEGMVSF